MACKPSISGSKVVMDCLTCGLELGSSKCLNSHLKTLSTFEHDFTTMKYEEEIIVDFDKEKARTITEYLKIIRQLESIILNPETYGHTQDEQYSKRKKALEEFYEYVFMSPIMAARTLEEYSEPLPQKKVFVEGYRKFQAWINGILKTYKNSRLYKLCEKTGDLRQAFLSLLGVKSLYFISSFILEKPDNAEPIDSPDANYDLGYGITTKIYNIPKSEANLYVQENPQVENMPRELQKLLKEAINAGMKENLENVDFTTIYDTKMREYRAHFLNEAALRGIEITPQQALAMGREAASWTVGLGAPIENMGLDNENITDIYIDSENSPLYIEHAKFGLCHTLWRYNHEMLEHAFRNIIAVTGHTRKFDEKNPVVDVMLTRLNMRCHLQRPPATFGDLQAALRMGKDKPFTYPLYLNYRSMSAFFAGYDDLMVSLGCSEAVLGLKGVGKTAYTSAKISSIGTKKRILPIQDIEEIPTRAYRKRGFHIGAMRVQSSDKEVTGTTNELDLVSMANASLRMGDSCLIINEIRSRLAIQGVVNLLNTQPGVFLLYNLHAQSLQDIADRLELVFGVPSASMFTTDRYSFLKKVRFGRKGRIYRVLGSQYETNQKDHKYEEIFTFKRGTDIDSSQLICKFVENPEANEWTLEGLSMEKIASELRISFIPSALERRSKETGVPPKGYVTQAFFKGKVYSQILKTSQEQNDKEFLEIDFVLRVNSAANMLLKELEQADGTIDWKEVDARWAAKYPELVKKEIQYRAETKANAGTRPPSPAEMQKSAAQQQQEMPPQAEQAESGEPPPQA